MAGSLVSALALTPLVAWLGAGLTAPLYPETVRLVSEMSAGDIWSRYVRYIGAGAVATAGILTVARGLPTMVGAFAAVARGMRGSVGGFQHDGGAGFQPAWLRPTDRDLPGAFVVGAIISSSPSRAGARRLRREMGWLQRAILAARIGFFGICSSPSPPASSASSTSNTSSAAAERFAIAPREWLDRIESGCVLLNGIAANGETLLSSGQILSWMRPPWEEPEVPLSFAILYRDDWLLGMAKPEGLPTMPGGGQFLEHTLLALVRRHFPDANPLHRLGTRNFGCGSICADIGGVCQGLSGLGRRADSEGLSGIGIRKPCLR